MKKVLIGIALLSIGIGALVLLLALFDIWKIEDAVLKLLFTSATFFVASLFSLNTVGLVAKKNIIAIASMLFLLFSSALFLIIIWGEIELEGELFSKITVISAILSILFNIGVGNATKLGKRQIALQAVCYIVLTYISITLVCLICGVDALFGKGTLFWAACVVEIALLTAISVLSKKAAQSTAKTVSISIAEYESMKLQISELSEKLKTYENSQPSENKH